MSTEVPAVAAVSPPESDDSAGRKRDHSMIRAIAWTGAAMWAAQFLSWVTTIYVARLLLPGDYGVLGMATVYIGLVSMVSEFGIGSAVVVLRELRGRQLAELNTLSVISGFLCLGVSFILAHPMAVFFDSPELAAVIKVMSSAFVIASFKVVPDSQLQQELRYKLLAHIDGAKAAFAAIATTVAAFAGLRYWSLVVGYLAAFLAGTVLTLIFRRHGFAWPRFRTLKPALKLSRDLVVSRLGWYLHSNSDFLIAGKVLGETPLGIYRLAWSISNIPVDKVSAMVMRSTQAFFSSAQKDYAELRRYLLGLTEGLALLTIPMSAGIILVANPLVDLALGAKWQGIVLPLQLLSVYAAIRSLTPLVPPILNVTGNSTFVARNTIWVSIVLPAGFYFAARWGAPGIAATWVILYPLCTIPFYWRAFHVIELPFRQYFRALSVPVTGTVALTIAVLFVKSYLPATSPAMVQLVVLSATGVVAYVGFILVFYKDRVKAFKETIKLVRSSS